MEHAHTTASASKTKRETSGVTKKTQRRLVGGNLGVGLTEIVTGFADALSAAVDGIHNIGDAAAYYMDTQAALNEHTTSEAQKKRSRTIRNSVISGSSLLAGVWAASEMVQNNLADHYPEAGTPWSVVPALGSFALSATMGYVSSRDIWRQQQAEDRQHFTPAESDFMDHLLRFDLMSSSAAVIGAGTKAAGAAFGGAVAQKITGNIEHGIAVASGVYGAWHFNPFRKGAHDHAHNLVDDPHEHACGHGHGHHASESEEPIKVGWQMKAWAAGHVAMDRLHDRYENWKDERTDNDSEHGSKLGRYAKLGAAAVAGAVVWSVSKGMIEGHSFGGAVRDLVPHWPNGGSPEPGPSMTSPMPHETPVPAPPQSPFAPPVFETPAPMPEPAYPDAARHIDPGEGWYQTMQEMGVPASERHDLLNQVGGQLHDIHYGDGTTAAYVDNGEWRMHMSPDGLLPDEALDLIANR